MGEARRKTGIEGTEMSVLIGSKSCRSCEWRYKQTNFMFCRRFPPQAQAFLQSEPNGQVIPTWMASYPMVNPDVPCGEYKRNDAHAAEELRSVTGMAAQ